MPLVGLNVHRGWLRGEVRDGPDRVFRASNEAEQPRIVARLDLHGAQPVERGDSPSGSRTTSSRTCARSRHLEDITGKRVA